MSIRFVQSWHKMTQKVITKIKKKDEEDELLGGDDNHTSPATENTKRNIFHEGRKRNRKPKFPHRKEEQKLDATERADTPTRASSVNEKEIDPTDTDISHASDLDSDFLDSNNDHVENGYCTDDNAENDKFPQTASDESLMSPSSSILSALLGWLEMIKAFFIAIAKSIRRTCEKMCSKLVQRCQFVPKCFLNVGKILFVAAMVWLDCLFRGVNSFVRMGTTSFFSVIWFSIFSVIAIIGILKFLLVLAITVLIGVLVGFFISLLTMTVSGGIFLWVNGTFWTTFLVLLSSGVAFLLSCQRLALLFTTVYSAYCAATYFGWLGVVLGLSLSFITSDAFAYFLKHNVGEGKTERADGIHVEPRFFSSEAQFLYTDYGPGQQAGQSGGVTSTSDANSEITSESEVIRLMNCTDHYSVLGFPRYQQVDTSVLKKEYRKRARLAHPDKNMGNEKAAQAFMKLQVAYEVLMDPAKQKTYDEELRKEEMQSYFSRFRCASEKKGTEGSVPEDDAQTEDEEDEPIGECRKIACKKCGASHMWFPTNKSISKARWCQDCLDFHEAKDGDGWVEQSSQALLFKMLRKADADADAPVAYVCDDDQVYDASEWFICQGMRCPPNTHKPTFQVSTSAKNNNNKKTYHRRRQSTFSLGGSMTDEEFFSWLQNTMQSGVFESFSSFGPSTSSYDYSGEQTSPKTDSKNNAPNTNDNSGGNSQNKKRRRGKKFW